MDYAVPHSSRNGGFMIETYEEFVSRLMNRISEEFSEEINFNRRNILKNNGKRLDAITLCRTGYNLCPTIYPEYYYEQYSRGMDFETLFVRIMEGIRREISVEDLNLGSLSDFSTLRDRITFRLINAARNEELLSEICYKPYLDLAIVFSCVVSIKGEETASFLIRREHLLMWDVTVDQLFALARENTPRLFPVRCQGILEVLEEEYPGSVPESFSNLEERMYVLTNTLKLHGAGCILYRHILRDLGEKLGRDLYLIPSSIHEMLIVPAFEEIDSACFRDMIAQGNADTVTEEEYLSDHAYFYKRKSNRLSAIA